MKNWDSPWSTHAPTKDEIFVFFFLARLLRWVCVCVSMFCRKPKILFMRIYAHQVSQTHIHAHMKALIKIEVAREKKKAARIKTFNKSKRYCRFVLSMYSNSSDWKQLLFILFPLTAFLGLFSVFGVWIASVLLLSGCTIVCTWNTFAILTCVVEHAENLFTSHACISFFVVLLQPLRFLNRRAQHFPNFSCWFI